VKRNARKSAPFHFNHRRDPHTSAVRPQRPGRARLVGGLINIGASMLIVFGVWLVVEKIFAVPGIGTHFANALLGKNLTLSR